MNIQWYPGHMTKAKRAMKEDMKLIDLVIELVDARVPLGSRNPDIDELAQGKGRMILLNKADLADERLNEQWISYFKEKGILALKVNARSGMGLKQIQPLVQEACKEKIERDRRRGIINRPVRTMVVGIPNVGKSTFINSFAGKACTKTGNKPGVTKGNQWIRLNKTLELLDTPGILWPRFEDQQVGLKLAFIGSINDEIIDKGELAAELLKFLLVHYKTAVLNRYMPKKEDSSVEQSTADDSSVKGSANDSSVEESANGDSSEVGYSAENCMTGDSSLNDPYEMLSRIAQARSCLLKGGELDINKAAALFLDDFRSGKLGRITLEFPEA